jgi:hypothetical protein
MAIGRYCPSDRNRWRIRHIHWEPAFPLSAHAEADSRSQSSRRFDSLGIRIIMARSKLFLWAGIPAERSTAARSSILRARRPSLRLPRQMLTHFSSYPRRLDRSKPLS